MVLFYLAELNRFKSLLDGNGSIISSGLSYQTFVGLIRTCGMGSDPLHCEGLLPPSTKLVLEGGPTKYPFHRLKVVVDFMYKVNV